MITSPFNSTTFRVTSPYGYREGKYAGFHNGIDVVSDDTLEVVAINDGIVESSTRVFYREGMKDLTYEWGNYVKVKHSDGSVVFYCHLAERRIAKGQRVKKGELIGIMGGTGKNTVGNTYAPHLHLEVRDSNNRTSANFNSATYIGIMNQIGTYKVEEDEPMTAEEKLEMKKLQAKVTELENRNKVYRYWSELPEWAKKPVKAMYDAKKFSGNSPEDLNLTMDLIRMLVIWANDLKQKGELKY